jgi:glycosyltransferase involved in cell wall biosynthesis
MTTPLFSVLIANYNNGIYIEDAINCVLSQTYENIEIILIDDASSDHSKAIYKKYENENKIKIFYNRENKGVAITKNNCINHAKGELCGFLDPDDILSPIAVEVMVKKHQESPNASMIYSNFYLVNENVTIITPYQYNQNIPKDLTLMVGLTPNHFTSFKKSAYLKTSGINLNFKRAIDRDLVLKLEEVGDVIKIENYLYSYRINKNSISNNENSYKAEYWAWKARFDALERRGSNAEDKYAEIRTWLDKNVHHNCIGKETMEYKIGNAIVKKLRYLKKFISK